jgi:hypothetical protein
VTKSQVFQSVLPWAWSGLLESLMWPIEHFVKIHIACCSDLNKGHKHCRKWKQIDLETGTCGNKAGAKFDKNRKW